MFIKNDEIVKHIEDLKEAIKERKKIIEGSNLLSVILAIYNSKLWSDPELRKAVGIGYEKLGHYSTKGMSDEEFKNRHHTQRKGERLIIAGHYTSIYKYSILDLLKNESRVRIEVLLEGDTGVVCVCLSNDLNSIPENSDPLFDIEVVREEDKWLPILVKMLDRVDRSYLTKEYYHLEKVAEGLGIEFKHLIL